MQQCKSVYPVMDLETRVLPQDCFETGFWATVCKTVRPMLSDRCLSCLSVCPVLSVTLVYCGQTVGWIKMKLGVQIGLGRGYIVLDGDPAPPFPKGHSPQFSAHIRCGQMAGWIKMPIGIEVGLGPGDCVRWGPSSPPQKRGRAPIFGLFLLWSNGWMYQDATWYGGRPQTRPHCARWRPSTPSKKAHSPPIVGPCLLWPNGWMDQDATWYRCRPRPRRHCVRWGTSSPKKKGHTPSIPPMSIVAKRLYASGYHLVWR